jgi:hopanoid biosynthesis associated protein HpnK
MTNLIVNGDDFGFARSTNAGILRGHRDGILTSATLMANGGAFQEAVEIALTNPGLGVGCHVALVDGLPVSAPAEVPSLLSDDGRLPRSVVDLIRKLGRVIRVRDVEREISAQVQRIVDAGITPTHLDTHKHTHLHPTILKALVRVAADFGIRRIRKPIEIVAPTIGGPAARSRRSVHLKQWAASLATNSVAPIFKATVDRFQIVTPDRFYGIALTGLMDAGAMINVLGSLGGSTAEIMCHPGINDDELDRAHTRLKQSREVELDALIDSGVKRAVEEKGIKLIDYSELG